MINLKTYNIQNLTLTHNLLSSFIIKFWNDIFAPLNNKKTHLMLMVTVEFNNSDENLGHRTLGHLRKVNFTDKDLFINYLTERLGQLTESYKSNVIKNITFSYIVKEGVAAPSDRKLLSDFTNKNVTTHGFNNYKLPISMLPSDFGSILMTEINDTCVKYLVTNNGKQFMIEKSLDGLVNKVTILGPSDLQWIDTKIDGGFKREIGKSTIYFVDGEIVLRKQQLPAKSFRRGNQDKKLISNFITMDIETIKNDTGSLIPYLICAYNGKEYINSYANSSLSTGIDQTILFNSFINQLLSFFNKSTKSLTIYAHNLSGFDGIFLLKHLLNFGKVEPLLFNGRLISIKVKLNQVGYIDKTLIFQDSFLLLPLPLRALCKAFNVLVPKGYFPFKLMDIFYNGNLPKFKFWTGIDLTIYNNLLSEYNKGWNFKNESIKYCNLDCKCLYDILIKFNELIFNEFKVNVHKSLTLPALAMRIYKVNFMPADTIYQILGNIEESIRLSYTGGAVDVYKPHNRISKPFDKNPLFKKLFYYDVNSLYPTVMANCLIPVGKPTYFEGDIRKYDINAFGFFYCKITSPDNMLHPILQRRIKTSEGIRTIAGLGTWTGWIFSGEMDNAIKNGYTFEILSGYLFDKGNIFSGYVNKMYALRKQYDKSHAMNLIAKLLMNSLYGKFGMKLENTIVDIFDISTEEGKEKFKEMLDIMGESIKEYIEIDTDKYIIVRDSLINLKYDETLDMYHGQDVNIAIASAITSYARVHMSAFKNNPNYNLYYSDTDSIVIDKALDPSFVGNVLGQLKLEHTIKKAVFLAPKVYGIIDTDGNKIIKVKGITHDLSSQLSIIDLENLLVENTSKEFTQEKWYKKVMEGEITISDIAYNLKATNTKRVAIYKDGIFDDTRPYHYNELIK